MNWIAITAVALGLLAFPFCVIGITAGASCPNNLIEDTIIRVFSLHGIGREQLL